MRLLVTRPQPDAERSAAALRAQGYSVIVAPLLRIETIDADPGSDRWAGVIMTSANAARAVSEHARLRALTKLPLFAVGARTAEAAHRVGFDTIGTANRDAADLVRLIKEKVVAPNAALLWLAGADRAADLAKELAPILVRTLVVYRLIAADTLPDAALAALKAREIDGVLHYSRRSATIYVDCARRSDALGAALAPVHHCLSQQVAEPLAAAGAGMIRVAARPDESALLAAVGGS